MRSAVGAAYTLLLMYGSLNVSTGTNLGQNRNSHDRSGFYAEVAEIDNVGHLTVRSASNTSSKFYGRRNAVVRSARNSHFMKRPIWEQDPSSVLSFVATGLGLTTENIEQALGEQILGHFDDISDIPSALAMIQDSRPMIKPKPRGMKFVCPAKGFPAIPDPRELKEHGFCPLMRHQWECKQYVTEDACNAETSCQWSKPEEKEQAKGRSKCPENPCGMRRDAVFSHLIYVILGRQLLTDCGEFGKKVAHVLDVMFSCLARGKHGLHGTKLSCPKECERRDNIHNYNRTSDECVKEPAQCSHHTGGEAIDILKKLMPESAGGSCTEDPPTMLGCLRAATPDSCFKSIWECRVHEDEAKCKAGTRCKWEKGSTPTPNCDESGKMKRHTKEEISNAEKPWCEYEWLQVSKKSDTADDTTTIATTRTTTTTPCVICEKTDAYNFFSCKNFGTPEDDAEDPKARKGAKPVESEDSGDPEDSEDTKDSACDLWDYTVMTVLLSATLVQHVL